MANTTWTQKLGMSSDVEMLPATPPQIDPSVPEELPDSVENQFNRAEVEESARNSLDFLAALAMPTIFRFFFPSTYHAIWALLVKHIHKTRDFTQIALGFPRAFAKTTFLKLFVLYVILFTQRNFICYCANNQKKANAAISDVMDFLTEKNILAVFGDYRVAVEKDTEDIKKFAFRGRDIILAAATVFSVRGLNIKHRRPDLFIFDDIQSKEDSESEVTSNSIEVNMYGTAMKAKSPTGCMFVFLANMYPTKNSLLRKIKNNPGWIKFIAGGILADGTSLWEDLQPISQLLKEFQNDLAAGRPEVFYAEVLNDETASVNTLVDITRIPSYPYDESEIPQGKYVIIDPAGDKKKSDDVTVGYYELINDKPVSKKIEEGRMSPLKTIETAITMCLTRNCNIIFIESNAYQATLGFWFEYICRQRGISGIIVIEIYSGSKRKNSRIIEWFKSLMAGEMYLHPDVHTQTKSQISSFNPLKDRNVDGILDCHYYALAVLKEHEQFIRSQGVIEMQDYVNIPVRDETETSAF